MNIKNYIGRWALPVLLGWSWSSASSAQEMRSIFKAMPDSLGVTLTEVNRADMVDFLESNMKARVTNRFGEESELKVLTKDYLQVEISPKVTWEMKLLPQTDSTQIVCMVRTVDAPVKQSTIHFYTSQWEPLPASDYWERPTAEDFFLPEDSIAGKDAADALFLHLSLDPESTSLSVDFTTLDFLPEETTKQLQSALRSRKLIYRWNHQQFISAEE